MVPEPAFALNPGHLESLLGQEVVITLDDNSTRQGTVCNVDPVNVSVSLRKVRPSLLGAQSDSATPPNSVDDTVCVLPALAVCGVEVVGFGERAMEALGLANVGGSGGNSGGHSGGGSRRDFANPFSGSPFREPPPARVSTRGVQKHDTNNSVEGWESVGYTETAHHPSTPRSPSGMVSRRSDDGDEERLIDEFASNRKSVNLKKRLERVRTLLHEARLPAVVESEYPYGTGGDDVLVVLGCVRIASPYTVQTCVCANEQVLDTVASVVALAEDAQVG